MTKEILAMMRERDKKRNEFNKVGTGILHKEYKKLRNRVQNLINYAKRDYCLNKCDLVFTSSQIWEVYNELSNYKTKAKIPISFLIHENKKPQNP